MKYIAACFSAGLLAFTALNGAENAANTTDAALFAGQGNAGIRYYRLGELALENFDAAGAVDFFRLALENLQDENLRLQATDLLLKSFFIGKMLHYIIFQIYLKIFIFWSTLLVVRGDLK